MCDRLIVVGADFKALIVAVSRFPTIGSFAGSDTISISAQDGKINASSFGVVLSKARVKADGVLPLVGVDERALTAFAALCPDASKVYLEVVGKELVIKCRRELTVCLATGTDHKMASTKDMVGLAISEEMVKKVGYLAQLAFSDSSRAELCCVMLNGEEAISCSPKIVASLKLKGMKGEKIPLPLALAKGLKAGDILYPGMQETILNSGIGRYSMPSVVKARTDYPLAAVSRLGKEIETKELILDGPKFLNAISECNSVLGSIARTEIVVNFACIDGKSG